MRTTSSLLFAFLLTACSGDADKSGGATADTGTATDGTPTTEPTGTQRTDTTATTAPSAVGLWRITEQRVTYPTYTYTDGQGSSTYQIDIRADGTWGYTQGYTTSPNDTDYYGGATYTWAAQPDGSFVLDDGYYREFVCTFLDADHCVCEVIAEYMPNQPEKVGELDLQRL
jgi:hypothetical protein